MIGNMISKIRKEKGITKTQLSNETDINIGHLTHIEKGERNPSQNALKNICRALNIPYQQLMFTYDKCVNEEQESYNLVKHISYNKLVAIDNIGGFIDCPPDIPSSAVALKVRDDSMAPAIAKNSYIFIEFNSPLSSKDIGLFSYNDKILVRKFYTRNGKITLKANNPEIEDIKVADNDTFYIIGKVFVK